MIARRTDRGFCLVIAALSALSGPVGVALSIFTLFVLTTPRVKTLFMSGGQVPEPSASQPT
jgi:hypothetical protein